MCNGYYGSSFGNPLCGICHSFLFPCSDEPPVTQLSDDEDSGNDEPPYNVQDKNRLENAAARPERNRENNIENEEDEDDGNDEGEEDEEYMYEVRPRPAQPRNLNQYIDLLSQPRENDVSQETISSLPVEGK